ncbi:S-adenosyl-L-methionine-dependent methyltransferase [Xylariaceae sp. FL0804]|nr:S-adenosyl-L-methionine-dependent methyltransferase [Xylariaceae sp. FL0804]
MAPVTLADTYIMPEPDLETEQERLDIQHQAWLLTLDGKLHEHPIANDTKSILDIGTGTGSWAIAIASAYPQAEVIATDLTLPRILSGLPANLQLMQHDAEAADWPFPTNHFDFVNGRMLFAGIHNWPGLVKKIWAHLAPGGRFELSNISGSWHAALDSADSPQASPFIRLGMLFAESWARNGIDPDVINKQYRYLNEAGFVDIQEHDIRWPVGEWAETNTERRIGALVLPNTEQFIKGLGIPLLTKNGFLTDEDAKKAMNEGMDDLVSNCAAKQFYFNMYVRIATLSRFPYVLHGY